MIDKEPDFTKPVDVLAFLGASLGVCGCSDLPAIIETVRVFLDRCAAQNEKLFDEWVIDHCHGDEGLAYLVFGFLDKAGLIDHGTAIRVPWLTPLGKSLLVALKTLPCEVIVEASGEAYDGCEYGDF